MEEITEKAEQNRFSLLLGLTSSILQEHLTGGTQHGRPFSAREAQTLKAKIREIKTQDFMAQSFTPMELSINSLEKAASLMLSHSFATDEVDPARVSPLLVVAGIQALDQMKTIEKKFNDEDYGVEKYLLCSKIVAIVAFYLCNQGQLGLHFIKSSDFTEEVPDDENSQALLSELQSLSESGIVDRMAKPSFVLDAFDALHCLDRKKTKKQQRSSGIGGVVIRSRRQTDLAPSTLKRIPSKASNFVEEPVKPSAFGKLTRNFRKKKSTPSQSIDKFAKSKQIVRSIFSLARLLGSFTGTEVFVAPRGLDIDPLSVPQIFQENFASRLSKKESANPKVMTSTSKYSVMVYHNNIIEIFRNSDNFSLGTQQLRNDLKDIVMHSQGDTLFVGARSGELMVFNLGSIEGSRRKSEFSRGKVKPVEGKLQPIKSEKFSADRGAITAISYAFSLVVIGFSSGVISLWSNDSNKEVYSCSVLEEDGSQMRSPVKFIDVDAVSGVMAAAYDDGKLGFWDVTKLDSTSKPASGLIETNHRKITALVAKNGELYTGGTDGCIRIWDMSEEAEVYCIRKAHQEYDTKNSTTVSNFNFLRRQPKGSRLGRKGSVMGSTERIVQGAKISFAITSLAVSDDTVFSAGLDSKFKVWDLSQLETKPKPVEVQYPSPIIHLDTNSDRYVYALGARLDRYEIDALLEGVRAMKAVNELEATFRFAAAHNDSKPTLVKNFETSELFSSDGLVNSRETIQEADGFDSVLRDKQRRKRFMKYLRKAWAQENLEFYLYCTRFKKLFNNLPRTTREREAKSIMKRYVELTAPKQINISASERKELLKYGDDYSEITAALFDEAIKEVYDLMKSNFYESFMKTEQPATMLKSQRDIKAKRVTMAAFSRPLP